MSIETLSKFLEIGQIERIALPENWIETYVEKAVDAPFNYRRFAPANEDLACLGFFYRGRRISGTGGARFRELLDRPPHVLSPQEYESIKEVLRDKNDPEDFKAVIAKTEDFNGKRVLIIEGRYLEIGEDNRSLYVDSDGSGTAVQEIFYQANRHIFARYYRIAAQSMKSIVWK